jgi:nucleotide-binding universal stress UspA family protein
MPVDFTASSESSVRFASPLVPRAHVHVLHATDTHQESVLRRSDVDESIIREVRAREITRTSARMRRKVGRLGLDRMRTSFAVARGPADQAALQRALAHGSDLIVVGRQERSALSELFLGSVSRRVLSGSPCDVLIVPSPRVGRPARQPWQAHVQATPGPVPAADL